MMLLIWNGFCLLASLATVLQLISENSCTNYSGRLFELITKQKLLSNDLCFNTFIVRCTTSYWHIHFLTFCEKACEFQQSTQIQCSVGIFSISIFIFIQTIWGKFIVHHQRTFLFTHCRMNHDGARHFLSCSRFP